MNVVFLSPHFPPQYHRFCRRLKESGANVLGIGDESYDHLAPGVCDSLTEYYRVKDMGDYDSLVRACGFFTHKYGKIDRFESLNEHWLTTEAGIRDDFNIVGVRAHQIDDIRRKSKMKEIFRRAGIPVARGRVVQTETEALDFIAETGLPVVAKPDAGVGALGTFRLDSREDVARFFRSKPKVDYFLEEFVAGTIVSYDGLADRVGAPIFSTSHVFSQGIMETVNEERHIHYYSLREIPPELENAGKQALSAFDVRERFFHIEFFRTGPGTYVGLEVNMRPPGGFTTDMFNYACDIDIYGLWARLLIEGSPGFSFVRKYHCCYASRKNRYAYRHRHEDIISRYGNSIVMTATVPGVFSSALGEIGYVFRDPKEEKIMEITRFIQDAV